MGVHGPWTSSYPVSSVDSALPMTNPLTHDQAWRIAAITITAILLYAGFRLLPTGTNLNHMDFRVEGGSSIEFCDPSNPPVYSGRGGALACDDDPPNAGSGARGRHR